MSDKFGVNKTVRARARNDVVTASLLGADVLHILGHYGEQLELSVPEDYPLPLVWPCAGDTNDEKGVAIMDYTLYITRLSYKLLEKAYVHYGYCYKIGNLPGQTGSYFVQVNYRNMPALCAIQHDYFQGLCWVVKVLKKSLMEKERNGRL